MSSVAALRHRGHMPRRGRDHDHHKPQVDHHHAPPADRPIPLLFPALFSVLCAARVLSALFNIIHDCDETFNYWEPTHLVLFQLNRGDDRYGGMAMQTWEYSPQYALRSWLYVMLHAWAAEWIVSPFSRDSIAVFFGVRVVLGVLCAACETLFLFGVHRLTGGRTTVTVLCAVMLVFSSGMFGASTAYLPSSFTMYFLMAAFGCWYAMHDTTTTTITSSNSNSSSRGKRDIWLIALIAFTGIAGIIGWPFCIVCVLPMVFNLLRRYSPLKLAVIAAPIALLLLGATLYYDVQFYGQWVLSPLNLLLYNKGSGSELYGVEPWHFYFKNLVLNFNIAFPLALAAPALVLLFGAPSATSRAQPGSLLQRLQFVEYLAPFHLWFFFFSSLAHKEERFLSVVYPVLCLSAAVALDIITGQIIARLLSAMHLSWRTTKSITCATKIVVLAVFILVCLSRTMAIIKYYSAPFDVYRTLHDTLLHADQDRGQSLNVCVGDEWYRYPGAFFLPDNRVVPQFVRGGFRGLLPKHFGRGAKATSELPSHMNDRNMEEMSRYVPIDHCNYLVDFDFADKEPLDRYDHSAWQSVREVPFLDANRSRNLLARTLYVPYYSDARNVFGTYRLLRRRGPTQ